MCRKDICLDCEKPFVKKQKGWKRTSVKRLQGAAEKYPQDGFLCSKCASKFKAATSSPKRGIKRVISTPLKPIAKTRRYKSPSISLQGIKEKASAELWWGKYTQAFRSVQRCHAGRAALEQLIQDSVRKETKSYPRKTLLTKDVNVQSITQWSWKEIVKEAETYMPMLMHTLKAALPDPATRRGTFMLGGQEEASSLT